MKQILVVIDMQNDFIDGALGTPEAQMIVGPVAEEIRRYDPACILATRDTHEEDYLDTAEGKQLPVPHCIRSTHGWALNEQVEEALRGAEVIDKPTFGSFALAERLQAMAQAEPISIELVGLCTDICVVSNALILKAALPETPITVPAHLCAGVTPETHRAALETMKMCQVTVT